MSDDEILILEEHPRRSDFDERIARSIDDAIACRASNKLKELIVTYRSKCDLNRKYPDGDTLLTRAARNDGDNNIEVLIRENEDLLNRPDNQGNTALIIACENGHILSTKVLLEMGAHINVKNNEGKTALMKACEKKHENLVELLLLSRADFWDDRNNSLVFADDPQIDLQIEYHRQKFQEAFSKCAIFGPDDMVFVNQVFPTRCLFLREANSFRLNVQTKDLSKCYTATSGVLLFVVEARIHKREVICRLYNGNDVNILLNGTVLTSVMEDKHALFYIKPVAGPNVLEFETKVSSTNLVLATAAFEVLIEDK